MKKCVISIFTALAVCFTVLCVFAAAQGEPKVFIIDGANVISSEKIPQIESEARRVAEKTGFNIVIASTDDIGTPKTDKRTVDYADDKYEELCGINTDGILFLINCDTKYDYISTSGACINYFSDYRIERVLDAIWDDMVDGDFAAASLKFIGQVEKYYDVGKANDQDTTVSTEEMTVMGFLMTAGVPIFAGGFIGLLIFIFQSRNYKLEKPGTRNYILDNSLAYDRFSDTFAGNTTRKVYSPRSSSSGGGGGGSRSRSHSSTHHSRSGGTHGGGGRHR